MIRAYHKIWVRAGLLAGATLFLAGCDRAGSSQDSSGKNVLRAAIPEATASASELPAPGIYGNLADASTGELNGIELEIHGGQQPMIDFTVCEAICSKVYRSAYQVMGNGMVVIYREEQQSGLGQTLPPTVLDFRLRRQGQDILMDAGWLPGRTTILKPLTARYGLKMAEDAQKKATAQLGN